MVRLTVTFFRGFRTWKTHVFVYVTAVVVFLSAFCDCQDCNSQLPGPGKCRVGTDPNANDTTVVQSSEVECNFSHSLCSYRQGCKDPEMANWTASNGFAETKQMSVGCGANALSVMESPWLNFTSVSCVSFTFDHKSPMDLDVFFDVRGGSLVTVEDMSTNGATNSPRVTIHSLIGKGTMISCVFWRDNQQSLSTTTILFRAYGGGKGSGAILRVFPISVHPGECDNADVNITGPPTTTGSTKTIARTTAATSSAPPSTVQVHNNSPTPETRVVSHGYSTSQESFTYVSTSHQDLQTTSDSGHPHGDMTSDGPDTAAIAGAAAAACIVIPAVVVAVVVWRKRRPRRKRCDDDSDNPKTELSVLEKGTVPGVHKTARITDDYSTVDTRVTPSSPPNRDYYNGDGFKIHSLISGQETDVSPYDLVAKDGAPSKRLEEDGDTYHHINHSNHKTCSTEGIVEDDYNHIAKAQKHVDHSSQSPSRSEGTVDDEYSHISQQNTDHKPLRPAGIANDDYNHTSPTKERLLCTARQQYSQVQKKGKNKLTSDGYSIVNKKAKEPTTSFTPKQPEGDYNTINYHGGNGPAVARKLSETASDPYNRIGDGTYRHDDDASGKASSPGHGSIQETDEYNTLDFDQAHHQPAGAEKGATSGKAYDHVMRDPDDTYSKANTGKLNIVTVIDSDYDHVEK